VGDVMDEKTYNKNFKLSTDMGAESLSEESILEMIKDNRQFKRQLSCRGYTLGADYDFIRCVTFSHDVKNSCGEKKNEEEKEAAEKCRMTVQKFMTQECNSDFRIGFASVKDSICMLFDLNKVSVDKVRRILEEIDEV